MHPTKLKPCYIVWNKSLQALASMSMHTRRNICALIKQAAVASILLYGCTTWTLTKRMEKKLNGNYTRMLWAILNESWRQHPIKQQMYGHLLPIMKTIKIRQTRHAGHCWRSRDKIISDLLLWTSSHGRAKAGQPAWTYMQQPCADTGCSPENLPEAMDDREGWRERVGDIHVMVRHDDDISLCL